MIQRDNKNRKTKTNRMSIMLGLVPAGVVLAFLFGLPISMFVIRSFHVDGSFSIQNYVEWLNDPTFLRILGKTFDTSIRVTVITLLLGYPFAYLIARVPSKYKQPLLLAVIIPFFTSTLIRTYAWLAILGNNGLINNLLISIGVIADPIQLVFNEIGNIIGSSQIQLPLMILSLYSVMNNIDRSLVKSALVMGASPASAFWRIFRPLSTPGIVAGCSLVFVTTLGFYITPVVLGGLETYLVPQSINARVSVLQDFDAAGAQATILLVAVMSLMILFRKPLSLSLGVQGKETQETQNKNNLWSQVKHQFSLLKNYHIYQSIEIYFAKIFQKIGFIISFIRNPILGLISGFTFVYLVLPMVVVIILAFSNASFLSFPPPSYSFRWFIDFFNNERWISSAKFSLLIALSSSLIATILGGLASFTFVRGKKNWLSGVYFIYLSPIVIPTIIFAVSLFYVVAPMGLIGNTLLFVLTYSVLGLPYVITVVTASLKDFNVSLEHAASILGAPPIKVLQLVTIPILSPAIISGFLLSFLTSFDESIISQYLSSATAVTLPVRYWQDIRLEISPRIAAVGTLFFVLAATVMLFLNQLKRRINPKGK